MKLRGRDPATGRVLEVGTDGPVIAHVRHLPDAEDAPWLLPGLVDLQVNGYAGHDVNGPDDVPPGPRARRNAAEAK